MKILYIINLKCTTVIFTGPSCSGNSEIPLLSNLPVLFAVIVHGEWKFGVDKTTPVVLASLSKLLTAYQNGSDNRHA